MTKKNTFLPPKSNPKAGIKLPETKAEWQISNDYFKFVFNLYGDLHNVDKEIIYLQNKLYDYFKVQYGTIKSDDPSTVHQRKYSNHSKRELKKALATLKQQNDDCYTTEIRYTSKLIIRLSSISILIIGIFYCLTYTSLLLHLIIIHLVNVFYNNYVINICPRQLL